MPQHDDARPHTSLMTQGSTTKFGWTVLTHSAYSPNLAPSDFHLFGVPKDAISGTKFETDDVIHALRTWLCVQGKAQYLQGIYTVDFY
jgi:histone-lysine N-methyltransferase SETMAR